MTFLSTKKLTVTNFRGVRGEIQIEFNQKPGLYYIAGVNKSAPRLGANDAGKALADYIELDTPIGRKYWGDLKPGDFVFGLDGTPTRIVRRFPQGVKEVFKISFDDGSFTIADGDHLWKVCSNKYGRGVKEHLLTTKEIIDKGLYYKNGSKYDARTWFLPIHEPVVFDDVFEVDPYIMGMWLGNGHKKGGRITVNALDVDVIERLSKTSYSKSDIYNSRERIKKFTNKNAVAVRIFGLKRHLKLLGTFDNDEKFVPEIYKYSSARARLEMVKGLMDSDGYCGKDGRTSFTSTSKQLADDFIWLIRSLGGKSYIARTKVGKYKKEGKIIECKTAYTVHFSLFQDAFFCERKKCRLKTFVESRRFERWVDSIEPAGKTECSCIQVEAEDGLFLANDFIVTHNSTLFCESYSWVINGRLSRSNRPGNDVVNWQSGSEPAGVVWEFSLDDKPHILARWRNPNKLVLDGITVEQADVDKLLPLSDAALRKTLLLDQFGTMFLSLRPEEKSRIFSETLNLDVFIRSAERASIALKDVETLVEKHKIDVSQQTALLAEMRDQLELAIKKEEQFEEERNRDLDRVRMEYRKAKAEMEEVTDKLNNARDAYSKIGKTDQRVKLNDLKLEERKLIQSIARLEADNESTVASIARFETAIEQYAGKKKICPECGQTVSDEHIKEKRDNIKRRLDRIREDLSEAEETLVVSRKELKKKHTVIVELEESLVEDEKAQSEVSKWAEVSLRCQRQANGLREQLKELKGRENAFTGQCDRLEKRRKQLVTERKETRAELEKAEGVAEVYKFWQKGFKEIRLEQIDTTLLELEIATNKHAEALGLEDWEIQFATDRETAKGTISHGFSVFLYPPGQKEPIAFENYAGGVSQRWQLATTSGLSEILLARSGIDTDFEIYDEPTTHLSSEGIDDLLECLRDRALTQKRRIYLIDHHVLDRGAFDGVFTVIKDKNGIRLENSVENA